MTARKTTKRHSKALVRKTSALTLADLKSIQALGVPNAKRTPTLPLDAIEVAPLVFQCRLANEDMRADREQVMDLVAAIVRTDNPRALDAILVTTIGGRYFVVDGHHRLDAYHTAKWSKGVPVMYFTGSIDEATDMALNENKKNRLTLSRDAKREEAWKRLVGGRASTRRQRTQAEISEITTVALRTVKRMAAVLKKHGDDVSAMTWMGALRKERDAEFEPDEGWKEKKARKLAKQLLKCGSLTKDAEITAMALHMVSSYLPKMLTGQWHDAATEVLLERAREVNPDAVDRLEEALDAAFTM